MIDNNIADVLSNFLFIVSSIEKRFRCRVISQHLNLIGGISRLFNKEFWNYAKLISGVLRYRMPLDHVIRLVGSLQLESESINTWKNGVERALKKYISDGTEAKGQKCPNCGHETLIYQEGCLICKHCGASRCG